MPSWNPAGPSQAQLEDRIVNPDLRNHSLPGPILNPEIMTGRAPYWASGAKNSTNFLLKLSAQNVSSKKIYFELIMSKCCLNGCTFDHLSSFLPMRTASVHIFFYSGAIWNENFSVFRNWEIFIPISIASLVLCFERSTGKEHFQKHSGPLRSGSEAVTFCKTVVVWSLFYSSVIYLCELCLFIHGDFHSSS